MTPDPVSAGGVTPPLPKGARPCHVAAAPPRCPNVPAGHLPWRGGEALSPLCHPQNVPMFPSECRCHPRVPPEMSPCPIQGIPPSPGRPRHPRVPLFQGVPVTPTSPAGCPCHPPCPPQDPLRLSPCPIHGVPVTPVSLPKCPRVPPKCPCHPRVPLKMSPCPPQVTLSLLVSPRVSPLPRVSLSPPCPPSHTVPVPPRVCPQPSLGVPIPRCRTGGGNSPTPTPTPSPHDPPRAGRDPPSATPPVPPPRRGHRTLPPSSGKPRLALKWHKCHHRSFIGGGGGPRGTPSSCRGHPPRAVPTPPQSCRLRNAATISSCSCEKDAKIRSSPSCTGSW